MKKILSFDVESNGLWGQAFAISAVARMEDGSFKEFSARCPIEGEIDNFVKQEVLPQMTSIPITHSNYKSMLASFALFYLDNKKDADVIVHMGLPVEAKVFIDLHNYRLIDDWDAPFPTIDISAYPEINTSVDTYNKNNNIQIRCIDGSNCSTHNPLYDSYAALEAYVHLMKK